MADVLWPNKSALLNKIQPADVDYSVFDIKCMYADHYNIKIE